MNRGAPIVVGVDGSAPALSAVRWAAREAVLRTRPLHLLSVMDVEADTFGGAVKL
ncbi:universal stress protein, partial [Klebsiella pneumoniae]